MWSQDDEAVPEVIRTAGREELEVSNDGCVVGAAGVIASLQKYIAHSTRLVRPAERLPYWQVTFLGTGAAIPAKYRNVTGIYVHLFARGGLMLDCGET